MMAYDWPGNVRELQNCIDRMTAVSSGPLLHTVDLPSSVQYSHDANRPAVSMAAAAAGCAGTVTRLEEVERYAILDALKKTKGDRGAAAHFLGIGRTTLYRKLKEYGLPGPATSSGRERASPPE